MGSSLGGQYGQGVVTRLGGKYTPAKAQFFDAWARAEGTKAGFNPFATTRSGYAGETNFNKVGVKNYSDVSTGLQATYDTLLNGHYDNIVQLLKRDNVTAVELATAVAHSPWGTGSGVLRVLGATEADAYDQGEQQTAFVAKGAAMLGEQAKQGLNIAPQQTLLDSLSRLGPLSARVAQNISQPAPVLTPTQPDQPTPEAAPEQGGAPTSYAGDPGALLENAVGGVKYTNLGGPDAHHARALGNWQSDNAWDLGVPIGTPVYAVNSGVVGDNIGVQDSRPKDGARVEIGGDVWYGHLSKYVVKPGQEVKAGDLIGYSGASANGAQHLHIGFRVLPGKKK